MIKEITITVKPEDEKNHGLHKNLIKKELQKNHIKADAFESVFVKKSLECQRIPYYIYGIFHYVAP